MARWRTLRFQQTSVRAGRRGSRRCVDRGVRDVVVVRFASFCVSRRQVLFGQRGGEVRSASAMRVRIRGRKAHPGPAAA
jgi:hypothetical protein